MAEFAWEDRLSERLVQPVHGARPHTFYEVRVRVQVDDLRVLAARKERRSERVPQRVEREAFGPAGFSSGLYSR